MRNRKGMVMALAAPLIAWSFAGTAQAIDVPFDNDPLSGSILISRADGLLGWVKQVGGVSLTGVAAQNNQGPGTVKEIDIGDIDMDGFGDILTARNVGPGVSGEVTWTERVGASNLGGQCCAFNVSPANSIAVGDLDGDIHGDAILGRDDGFITWVEHTPGNLTANHTQNVGGVTALAIGNLDGDGFGDVVSAQPGGLLVWSETTAISTLSGVFAGFNVSPVKTMEIGDLDLDGNGDIIVGRNDGFITWVERSGNNLTGGAAAPSFNLGSIGDLALGDVNGDGDDEIIVAQGAPGGSVFILDHNGLSLSSIATPFLAAGPGVSIVSLDVGDLDGDAFLDIVVGRDDGFIVWMEATAGGTVISGVTSFNAGHGTDLRIASRVPEPASLALLGMGAAVLIRRHSNV